MNHLLSQSRIFNLGNQCTLLHLPQEIWGYPCRDKSVLSYNGHQIHLYEARDLWSCLGYYFHKWLNPQWKEVQLQIGNQKHCVLLKSAELEATPVIQHLFRQALSPHTPHPPARNLLSAKEMELAQPPISRNTREKNQLDLDQDFNLEIDLETLKTMGCICDWPDASSINLSQDDQAILNTFLPSSYALDTLSIVPYQIQYPSLLLYLLKHETLPASVMKGCLTDGRPYIVIAVKSQFTQSAITQSRCKAFQKEFYLKYPSRRDVIVLLRTNDNPSIWDPYLRGDPDLPYLPIQPLFLSTRLDLNTSRQASQPLKTLLEKSKNVDVQGIEWSLT